ncbi:MAG TPA: hypothetical protein PKD73_16615 [Burkholderiaceae bacterium]|jgi:hypothetical protein|nr:hypothetical protein [Burkholderiaceae bacterium]
MMPRELVQAWREDGIKLFALPLVVVLALAVLFDRALDPYLERRERAQDLALKSEKMRATLERGAMIESAYDNGRAVAQALQPRMFVAADAPAAAADLAALLRRILDTLYFEVADITPGEPMPKDPAGTVSVQARFFGVPQQLPRLEEAMGYAEKDLELTALRIDVVPDTRRGGQQIEVRATVTGFYAQQDLVNPPPPKDASNTGKKKT